MTRTTDQPPDRSGAHPSGSVEFTLRAILTGMALGAILTPCNIYSGLKIGWSFNMSIAAGLLAAGLWRLMQDVARTRPLGLLENNINQTTASSAASIISGGLVAPIPALTLITGQTFAWYLLAFWVFAVSILGVVVAAGIRAQMIEREGLRFPAGVATAETMTQIHSRGAEAAARLRVLLSAAGVSAAVKLALDFLAAAPRLAIPGSLPLLGAARAGAPGGVTFGNLGFAFDPSLLMLGFGAIIGLRAGVSLLVGAILAWAVAAPLILSAGWAQPGPPGRAWYGELVTWLLWPGVSLIVFSALTAFTVSAIRALRRRQAVQVRRPVADRLLYAGALAVVTGIVVVAASVLFGLPVWVSILSVALSFVLAVVAARVTGETGITPIGALGKITQLSYGVATPGDVTANLMTANVTGGAAGQCADLMHDLKTGHIIGATPRLQIFAQVFGVLTGSLVGAWVYLVLVPDPKAMLLTPEWPAPAVATWKAVAEVLSGGLDAIPTGATPAMIAGAVLGAGLGLAERLLPERWAARLPSAPALGLAFVLPAWNSISLFLGALGAAVIARAAPGWARRRTVALAAGLVAGESLMGVALAAWSLAS